MPQTPYASIDRRTPVEIVRRRADRSGQRHMEYLRDHGSFDDVPLARLCAGFARLYPGWGMPGGTLARADFDADVSGES